MFYVRGAASDYDDWEALGNKGWGFNEVLPLIRKVNTSGSRNEMIHHQPCRSKRSRPYQIDQPMVTRDRSRYLLVELTLGLEPNS
jgi:choline dehydrogenase-like flavoprotein